MIDYQPSDKLSINILNIYGDDYGDFIQNDPVFLKC
jgi:hypothetical protein